MCCSSWPVTFGTTVLAVPLEKLPNTQAVGLSGHPSACFLALLCAGLDPGEDWKARRPALMPQLSMVGQQQGPERPPELGQALGVVGWLLLIVNESPGWKELDCHMEAQEVKKQT